MTDQSQNFNIGEYIVTGEKGNIFQIEDVEFPTVNGFVFTQLYLRNIKTGKYKEIEFNNLIDFQSLTNNGFVFKQ